ncbi:MAG: DUF1538 domain-containing protein [Alphaproteobacteria bacterium]|nr:DUF1538 domain-containing protein [Alphaproteobacteria bacterium]
MNLLLHLSDVGAATMLDVLPIVLILAFFQIVVIRKKPANLQRIVTGFLYVLLGLTLFLVGLQEALFPIGEIMARQLTDPAFLGIEAVNADWRDYGWVYAFAFAIGFATTFAEPALMAVAAKANQVSGGAISVRGLRVTVAIGVSFGVALGSFRIVTGTPLHWYIIAAYAVLILLTARVVRVAREIVPLAYDAGGVTTSTVTVPLITALGLGLASTIPGRSPVLDGFGLIAFACLFPIISVLGYAELSAWKAKRRKRKAPNCNGSKQ